MTQIFSVRSGLMLGLLAMAPMMVRCGGGTPNQQSPQAAPSGYQEQSALASLGILNAKLRTPVAGRPSAAYLGIENQGQAADRLVSIRSADFARVEIHDTQNDGGMKKMVKLDGVDIGPGSTVDFAPGGKHLMLFDPTRQLKNGDTVSMDLSFANAGPMTIRFVVLDEIPRQASDMNDMDHSGMDHSQMDHSGMDHGAKDGPKN
jgi:copper(I)-binding protein